MYVKKHIHKRRDAPLSPRRNKGIPLTSNKQRLVPYPYLIGLVGYPDKIDSRGKSVSCLAGNDRKPGTTSTRQADNPCLSRTIRTDMEGVGRGPNRYASLYRGIRCRDIRGIRGVGCVRIIGIHRPRFGRIAYHERAEAGKRRSPYNHPLMSNCYYPRNTRLPRRPSGGG